MKRFIPLLIISLYPFPYFVGESRGNDDESVNSELQRPDRFRVLSKLTPFNYNVCVCAPLSTIHNHSFGIVTKCFH